VDASKSSSIKKGEPITFTLSQVSATSAVTWTVSPSTNTQIKTSGNKAAVQFGAMGSYTVKAVSGTTSASATVSVTDDTLASGATSGSTTLPFSSGEQIKITTSKIDSSASGQILVLSAQTTNGYTCLSNYLLSAYTVSGTNYNVNYTGVSVPADCTTGTAKAGAFTYLNIPVGTSTLKITFSGTTYTGTIVRTGGNFAINWTYTSGVTISPTSL
jgi:hypothetical protein